MVRPAMTAALSPMSYCILENPMTTTTRTRQAGVTAYYLGRPAAVWLAASAPPRAKPTRKTSG
jgi:hypothetical protein